MGAPYSHRKGDREYAKALSYRALCWAIVDSVLRDVNHSGRVKILYTHTHTIQ